MTATDRSQLPGGPTIKVAASIAAGFSAVAKVLRADALMGLLPEPARECLRRCALPLTFHESTFADLLRPEGGPDLSLLQAVGQVRPVEDGPGRYRLSPSARDVALADWWAADGRPPALELPIPPSLAELAARLAEVARREGRTMEELDLALLYDPVCARSLFRQLYSRADDDHDLALCRALLDVLDQPARLPLLGPDLAALRNETATYLGARSLWADNFHRSSRYVSRAVVEAALENLLVPGGSRILQLYARGGMGKSLQLKWFTARRCAPAPVRVPCALLDFDNVHPAAAARHPWLLLLEEAAQLDRQIPAAPFQELLAAHGHYRSLLRPGDDRTSAPRAIAPSDGEDVAARFVAALEQVPQERPVVIVFDTVEEVFRPAVNPAGIIDQLAELTERLPAVRFVLAGRYDLRERLPRKGRELPGLMSQQLQPLTVQEQRHYLTQVRGVKDAATLRQIIFLSEGLPLTLAMYANMVEKFDGVTAEELASYRDPGLHSAIKRVVARVPDHRVRWLLRYGVIPRQLCFDFVVQVMWPHLDEGMSGRSPIDDPSRDLGPHHDVELFRTDLPPLADESELRSVWHTLLDYAADYGWVSASPSALTVQFRRDLLTPLRKLVQQHQVYAQLQRDAAEYFERRASQEPAHWADAIREVIYHRFQVDPDAAARTWREALGQARSRGRDDWCLHLATDLLDRDFLDWEGQPLPPMTHQVLAEAQLERARAATALADGRNAGREDPLWIDVEDGLEAALALEERQDVQLDKVRLAALQARLSLVNGDVGTAEMFLADASGLRAGAMPASREMADVERALGQALLTRHRADAGGYLAASYAHARAADDVAGARLSALMLMRWHLARGAYAAALDVLGGAREDGAFAAEDDEADLLQARLLIEVGTAQRGSALAQHVIGRGGPRAVEGMVTLALARLRLDDPFGCVRAADQALGQPDLEPATAEGTGLALALRGLALAELHLPDLASEDLLGAASRARTMCELNTAARYAAAAAIVETCVAGNLREAAQCLDEAQRSAPSAGGPGWIAAQLAHARLLVARNESIRATEVLAAAYAGMTTETASPQERIRIAVEALATCTPSDRWLWLTRLVEHLREIEPVGARWSQLRELSRVPVLVDPSQPAPTPVQWLCDELRAAVVDGLGTMPGEPDETAARSTVLAELERVLGRHTEARRLLDEARDARANDLVGWWRWLQGMARLGPAEWGEAAPPDRLLEDAEASPPLLACCQVLLARRRLHLDPARQAEARLEAAQALLKKWNQRTQWNAFAALGRAEVAESRGETEKSLVFAAEAVRTFASLGAAVERRDAARRFTVGDRAHRDDADTAEVRMGALESDHLSIAIRLPGAPELTRQLPRAGLGDLASGDLLARTRRSFAPLAHGWREWSKDMAERVLLPELARRLAPSPGRERDIRLVFSSRDLAHHPWELSRGWDRDAPLVQGAGVHTVYRCLRRHRREEAVTVTAQAALQALGMYPAVVDGLSGHRTEEAVRAFQTETGLAVDGVPGRDTFAALRRALTAPDGPLPPRPLRVVVLRPDTARQLERQRGEMAAGSGLLGAYLRHGAQARLIEDPTADRGRAVTSTTDLPPDIIHVAAHVRFGGGASVLDFGGDAGQRIPAREAAPRWGDAGAERLRPGSELTVSGLADLVHVLAGDRLPLLILDVPLPGTFAEAMRALSARNSFAYQLMELGGLQALLATGLAAPHDQIELIDRIVGGLSRGGDAAEVARDIHRARPPDDLGSMLAFPAMALHLERPPFALLPVWAS